MKFWLGLADRARETAARLDNQSGPHPVSPDIKDIATLSH